MRLITAAAIIGALATAITGCAGRPEATGPAPTSTATHSQQPEGTDAPSTEVPPTTDADFGAFTRDELAQICVDATATTFDADVSFHIENTRIERRTVTPEWLVIVPARTGGMDGRSLCTIGGTPSVPSLELSSGSIGELPEEQVQRLIRGENEGGDR